MGQILLPPFTQERSSPFIPIHYPAMHRSFGLEDVSIESNII